MAAGGDPAGCYTFFLVFHLFEQRIERSVSAHLSVRYGAETEAVLEPPKEPRFGELGLVSAFQLARQLRKPPRAIAAEIVAEMPPIAGVAALDIGRESFRERGYI